MAQALRASIALLDYLAMDDASERRHEYVAGQVFAMTGGTERHNRVAGNVYRILADRLEGTPCQVFINDMKLHVEAADSVYYPDVFVRCRSTVATTAKVARDAALIVEVLSAPRARQAEPAPRGGSRNSGAALRFLESASTAGIDRREKLPGLRAYWMVSQDEQRVEVHERDSGGVRRAVAYTAGDALPAGWLGGDAIAIGRLYAGTELG